MYRQTGRHISPGLGEEVPDNTARILLELSKRGQTPERPKIADQIGHAVNPALKIPTKPIKAPAGLLRCPTKEFSESFLGVRHGLEALQRGQ